jgi:hypothetical protein
VHIAKIKIDAISVLKAFLIILSFLNILIKGKAPHIIKIFDQALQDYNYFAKLFYRYYFGPSV